MRRISLICAVLLICWVRQAYAEDFIYKLNARQVNPPKPAVSFVCTDKSGVCVFPMQFLNEKNSLDTLDLITIRKPDHFDLKFKWHGHFLFAAGREVFYLLPGPGLQKIKLYVPQVLEKSDPPTSLVYREVARAVVELEIKAF